MAEPVEFIPWSWIPAVHKGDRIRAAYLLWYELVSTRSSDSVHMWIRYRQNWLWGWVHGFTLPILLSPTYWCEKISITLLCIVVCECPWYKLCIIFTIAVQLVATCRQLAYLHKQLLSLWRHSHYDVSRLLPRRSFAPTALAAPVLIMTSFSLWRHSLLSWPRPPIWTYVRTDICKCLIYKD